MRALLLVVLLVAPLAGCAQPVATTKEPLGPQLLALDGRWPLPVAAMQGLLADASWRAAAGAAWFGRGVATWGDKSATVDFAALEPGAAALLDATGALAAPAPGEVVLNGSWARANGLAAGDALALRATAFPKPLVAAAYEMERVRTCEQTPQAKLCFEPTDPGFVALRLRVGADAQDLAFVPEGAELGPGGLPAWWNGSLEGPEGTHVTFHAALDEQGRALPATVEGPVAPGNWTVRFRLESHRHDLDGAAAGIVRVREPGYGWFDDRLVGEPDPAAQAREALGWGRDERAALRVARLAERAIPGGDALLSPADAARLVGAREDEATGLVVDGAQQDLRALSSARNATDDAAQILLRARPVPWGGAGAPTGGDALLFLAPVDVDVAALPRIDGALAPRLVEVLDAPVGERGALEGKPVDGLRLVAFAGPGAPPWRMPEGGRWTNATAALENLTRSRTLVIGGDDWAPGALVTNRLALGDDRLGRIAVVVEGVGGGPARVGWASPSLVAGAGKPTGAGVVLPLAPGADAADVLARARAAWGPLGLAPG